MLFEEGAEEESKVLNKVLLIFLPVLVCFTDVCAQWKHLCVCVCVFVCVCVCVCVCAHMHVCM